MYRQQVLEQRLEEIEAERVGAVGFGVRGVVVDFKKEAVDACGYGGAGEERDELGLATADSICRRWLLHRVGAVKDYGGDFAHDGEGAEIDHKVVVAEAGAALGEGDAVVACGLNFLYCVRHVRRGDELALLDVHGAAGFASGYEQVRLAAEEGWNLEHVYGLRDGLAVCGFMHVGEDGQAGVSGDLAEDADTLSKARAAIALDAGAVGFVVAGLEDVRDAEIGSDALNGVCHFGGVGLAFNDAGSGDKKQPPFAYLDRSDFKRVAHEGDCNLGRLCDGRDGLHSHLCCRVLVSPVPKC